MSWVRKAAGLEAEMAELPKVKNLRFVRLFYFLNL
jgi:hypothetical protein